MYVKIVTTSAGVMVQIPLAEFAKLVERANSALLSDHEPSDVEVNLDCLPTGISTPVITALKEIFSDNPGVEYTARTAYEELCIRNVKVKAKQPLVTVSIALKKLTDRGVIVVSRQGFGKEPHFYRLAPPPSCSAAAEERN